MWVKLIGIIIIVLLITKYIGVISIVSGVNGGDNFCNHGYGYGRDGKNCGNVDIASRTCGELAAANCRIPTTQMNDCWLNAYSACKKQCSMKGFAGNCNCYDIASDSCGSGNEPAIACYADLQQKCMAGLGLAPDPDRGMPMNHIVN